MVQKGILSSLILVLLISTPFISLTEGAREIQTDEGSKTTGPYIPTGPWDRDNWTRYRNLNDTLNEIMLMKEKFPNILRVYNLSSMFRYQNGTPRYSIQGRTIWGIKISDDPDINDTEEPEVFYCAMTHAREWITNEALMYYINYVLHNYLVNSTVNDIVNNTQMWFIPVVNPDGFQRSVDNDDFNNSHGIYGWRKNVNETNGIPGLQEYGYGSGDGTDLNRNFGYQWNGPGSSTDPNNILYRGSSPFSEPETQIIRELATSRNFTLGLSFHSYSGLNLYPWGHTTNPAPDANLMKEIATGMSRYNGYTPLQGANLYPVNGDIGDFMYGSMGVPTFTVEINGRNPRFIPEIEKISEDCKFNREAAFVLPKISHDIYSIFQSGIRGHVMDPFGGIIPDALVNLTGKGRALEFSTDENGDFNISLEPGIYTLSISAPGGLDNTTTTKVRLRTYEEVTYLLYERVPPEVASVNITLNGTDIDRIEWGKNATIIVKENFTEGGLTGWVSVFRTGTSVEEWKVPLTEIGDHYEAEWDTSEAEPWTDYSFESVLADRYMNMDLDGSNSTGPDRTLLVIDTTPPIISEMSLSGVKNPDGSFEWGSLIQVSVPIIEGNPPEKEIKGGLYIHRNGTLQNTTELEKNPVGTVLRTSIPTADLGKGEKVLTAVVRDGYGNRVETTKNITIRDTTPPELSLYLAEGITYPHEAGKELHVHLVPDLVEDFMDPWVEIFVEDESGTDRLSDLTDPMWDPHSGSFIFRWLTTGLQTASYHLEGRMRDEDGNYKPEGEKDGWDLTVLLKDVTPPNVEGVRIDGILVEPGSVINVTGGFLLRVISVEKEIGMECSVEVFNSTGYFMKEIDLPEFTNGIFQLYMDNRTLPFNTFRLEVVLSDRWGNSDPDGYGPGPDLILTLNRDPVEMITVMGSNLDNGDTLSPDRRGWVLAGERLRFDLTLSNFTAGETIHFYAGSSISSLEPTNIDGGLSHFETEIDTTDMFGDVDIRWRIFPLHLEDIEAGPISLRIVRNETVSPKIDTITGWTDLGNGMMVVNISWEPVPGAIELRVYILYEGQAGTIPENLLEVLPGNAVSGSFEVLRKNVTFLISSVSNLFPGEADRTLLVESFDQGNGTMGGSMISFHPPPPKEGLIGDENENDITLLWVIIPALLGILLVILIMMLFILSRRRRTMAWDME
ncbi:MAG: M14 family zinc carboxypeptidase [Thermoplasmatota archaeon]